MQMCLCGDSVYFETEEKRRAGMRNQAATAAAA
jgi:hypothetical protein